SQNEEKCICGVSANRPDPVVRRMIRRTGTEGQIAAVKRKQRYGEQNCERQQDNAQHFAQTSMIHCLFRWFPSHDPRLKKVTELTIKFGKTRGVKIDL